jgi:hypothetical protein
MIEKLDLTNQTCEPEGLARLALEDQNLLLELLDGVLPTPQPEARRSNCSQALLWLAENQPQALLPFWEHFVTCLRSTNGFSIYVAIYVIAALAAIDEENRFSEVCSDYLALFASEKTMVAGHAIRCAAKIALASPPYRSEIIRDMLNIENIHRGKNMGLVVGYVIEALELLFDTAENKGEIFTFVERHSESDSPRTRKQAKAFMEKIG